MNALAIYLTQYVKNRFTKEFTTYAGVAVLLLWVANEKGAIPADDWETIKGVIDYFGLWLPGMGAALVAAPTSNLSPKPGAKH